MPSNRAGGAACRLEITPSSSGASASSSSADVPASTIRPRSIKNTLPDWPDTLQGKAREPYDVFERHAKPHGYHLKAGIINFPGGFPGDVSLFLSRAPPAA